MSTTYSRSWFFAVGESIRDTLDIEDHGDSSKDPSEWWVLGLELSQEDVGLASGLVHVHRALIDTLLFFALNNRNGLAVDNRDNGELLLRFRLLKATRCVPSGTLNLESEDIGTVAVLLFRELIDFPIPTLLHLGHDVELVQLDCISSGGHLFDCGEEGLRVIQPVDEGNVGLLSGVLLPSVELFEALLDVVEP